MARRFPIPNKATPFFEADGKTVSQGWYDFFGYIDAQVQVLLTRGLSGLPDVQLTSLANNQVLIWKSVDSKWENGAN
jgi:hypothetical protein